MPCASPSNVIECDGSRPRNCATFRRAIELLSPRECEVLSLVITGPLNKQIAAEMKLSEVTVKVHRANVMKKLGAKSLPDLVKIAGALGVVPRDIKR